MEKNLGDIRKLLKYEFELGHNAKQAVTNINRAKELKQWPILLLRDGSRSFEAEIWKLMTRRGLVALEKLIETLSSTLWRTIRR